MLRSGSTTHAAGAIERHAERAPSGDALTPAAHSTVPASMLSRRPPTRPWRRWPLPARSCAPARRDAAAPLRRTHAAPRGNASRMSAPPSSRMIRARCGWIDRNSCASVCRAISASAPASSTPVGPPPTTTNVSHRSCARGIALTLGLLEREQHAPADRQRIVQRLESGCDDAPIRHARNRRAWRRWRRSESRRRARRCRARRRAAPCRSRARRRAGRAVRG